MNKILLPLLLLISSTVFAQATFMQLESESVIYASDINQRFADINTAITRASGTPVVFKIFQIGESISRQVLLDEFAKLGQSSPSGTLGSLNGNNPSNEIRSSELNAMFDEVIDVQLGSETSSMDDFITVTKTNIGTTPLLSQNFNLYNEDYYYTSSITKDLGLIEDYPFALLSVDDTCVSDLLAHTSCDVKFNFDSDLFHNNVTFSKNIFFNGVSYPVTLLGTSACPAGQVYATTDKLSCVDNLGVFDDPDSVFGHAVYQ